MVSWRKVAGEASTGGRSGRKKPGLGQRFLLFFWLWLFLPAAAAAAAAPGLQYITNGGYMVAAGDRSLQHQADQLFIPASTLKLLTCLAALERLGTDFRFETHFFLDGQNNLYIKGFGDPHLTSETLLEIGRRLAALGVHQAERLLLDDSNFALAEQTPGSAASTNPYDAPNGALAVNFNALPIRVGRDRTISSGEPQTPLLGLMQEAAQALPPGEHRINIGSLAQSGSLPPSLRYAGELVVAQLHQAGIRVRHGYRRNEVPTGLKPIYVYRNPKPLTAIVAACLKYSNNFIANQLLLAGGANQFGLPATWAKGRRFLTDFAETALALDAERLRIEEGSGLSRRNRASPAALIRVLDRFRPYATLLNRQGEVLLKSGTMQGIYCYAGYLPADGSLVPFVILLNQPQNHRDRLLDILRREISRPRADLRPR